jgi:hypothetical protein
MEIPEIKATKCYYSSDNVQHDTIHKAQIQECGLKLLEMFIGNEEKNDGQLKRIALLLAKKLDKFDDVFQTIRRIRKNETDSISKARRRAEDE